MAVRSHVYVCAQFQYLSLCNCLTKNSFVVLPHRRHVHSILELTAEESSAFASILSEMTIRFDNLFSCSFAYSMGLHQAPISLEAATTKQRCLHEYEIAHLHLHFYPPLLRSATVRKFLVGFVRPANCQENTEFYILVLKCWRNLSAILLLSKGQPDYGPAHLPTTLRHLDERRRKLNCANKHACYRAFTHVLEPSTSPVYSLA